MLTILHSFNKSEAEGEDKEENSFYDDADAQGLRAEETAKIRRRGERRTCPCCFDWKVHLTCNVNKVNPCVVAH